VGAVDHDSVISQAPAVSSADRRRLVLLSFLMLFVELALIRWTGSNVIYLSYFSNFILLGSFLGIGIGFLRSAARRSLFPWAPVLLAFFIALVLAAQIQVERPVSDLLFFGRFTRAGVPTWLLLPAIFLAVAGIMAMITDGVARTFSMFPPLVAYRLDILGSIGGVVAFSLLSFTWAPPLAWGIIVGAIFFILLRRPLKSLQMASVLAIVIVLAKETLAPGFSWSPYYKLYMFSARQPGFVAISVNGIPHQTLGPVRGLRQNDPQYFVPYERAPRARLDNVLVIGAGSGNDVAIALANGAGHVDAVEIDPRIQKIGKDLHPDHPYSDPRVEVHIQDGRAFLQSTARRYDMILFALPDSLTLVAGQSSLRLESYLFTREAFQAARAHLEPDGVFAMYNFYRETWLIDRFANAVDLVFGHPPCIDALGTFGHFAVLTAGMRTGDVQCRTVWRASEADVAAPATDDHPFPYLRGRSIPGFYLLTIALILLAALVLVRVAGGPLRGMGGYVDLFFMGAAFLLLETKSVVQFALLFGTTWFVNALVFAGVLLSVLAAIEVASRVRLRRPGLLYTALLVMLALAWSIPQERLLSLGPPVRFFAATALAFAPIFVANLVFAERFKDVSSSTTAFGANLLGAMVGGLLEYGALIVGYRALLLVVAGLYGLAFLSGRSYLSRKQPGRGEAIRPTTHKDSVEV
jgi:SAM-dependent methyltransferase